MLPLVGTAAALNGRIGCAGVANAGEEEGIGFAGAGVGGGLNIGAARGFSGWCGRLMAASLEYNNRLSEAVPGTG